MTPNRKLGLTLLWSACATAGPTMLQANVIESAEIGQTKATMGELTQAMAAFNRKYGYYPPTTDNAKLMAMLTGVNRRQLKFVYPGNPMFSNGLIRDDWDRPLVFITIPEGLRIQSLGKDGIPETKDDLIQEVPPKTD